MTPQLFAPDVVSLPNRFDFSGGFTPGGSEFYFTCSNPDWSGNRIMVTRQENGYWTSPTTVPFSGWDVDKFLAGTGRYRFKSAPSACDVLEGWSGAAYRRRFFDGVDIFDVPPVYKFVDDVWISSRLHRRGITRRLIATPTAFVSNPYPGGSGLHTRYDFIEMNRLAAIDGFS